MRPRATHHVPARVGRHAVDVVGRGAGVAAVVERRVQRVELLPAARTVWKGHTKRTAATGSARRRRGAPGAAGGAMAEALRAWLRVRWSKSSCCALPSRRRSSVVWDVDGHAGERGEARRRRGRQPVRERVLREALCVVELAAHAGAPEHGRALDARLAAHGALVLARHAARAAPVVAAEVKDADEGVARGGRGRRAAAAAGAAAAEEAGSVVAELAASASAAAVAAGSSCSSMGSAAACFCSAGDAFTVARSALSCDLTQATWKDRRQTPWRRGWGVGHRGQACRADPPPLHTPHTSRTSQQIMSPPSPQRAQKLSLSRKRSSTQLSQKAWITEPACMGGAWVLGSSAPPSNT